MPTYTISEAFAELSKDSKKQEQLRRQRIKENWGKEKKVATAKTTKKPLKEGLGLPLPSLPGIGGLPGLGESAEDGILDRKLFATLKKLSGPSYKGNYVILIDLNPKHWFFAENDEKAKEYFRNWCKKGTNESLKEDWNDLDAEWESISSELADACNKALGTNIKADDVEFDDSRAWSLFVPGSKLGLSCRKFGAYRNYEGGGVRGGIQHNGREEDGTLELGKLFADKLSYVEELIDKGFSGPEWENPAGVLLKDKKEALKPAQKELEKKQDRAIRKGKKVEEDLSYGQLSELNDSFIEWAKHNGGPEGCDIDEFLTDWFIPDHYEEELSEDEYQELYSACALLCEDESVWEEFVVIEAHREGYGIDQVSDSTLTAGDLIAILEQFPEDSKVVISNDNGYTYGSLSESDIDFRHA